MIRTFVAIEMPAVVRDSIATLQQDLRGFPVRVSWVRPANIHLTLKFLGDIRENQVGAISEALARVGEKTAPFSLSVGTLGFFPNRRRPRVLWVGISNPDGELRQLAESVENALLPLGFKKEKRGFNPHLTFGRVRDPRNIEQVMEKLETTEFEEQAIFVKEMVFMKSTLHPRGSIYEPLKRIALGGNDS